MNTADVLIRSAKTALQSGLAVVVAAGTDLLDVGVWQTAGIAALAAGVAAVHNALLNLR